MIPFFRKLRTRLAGEGGNNLVEYALVLALISTGVTAGIDSAGASVNKAYTTITSDMSSTFGSAVGGSSSAGSSGTGAGSGSSSSGGSSKGGGKAKGGGGKGKGGGKKG